VKPKDLVIEHHLSLELQEHSTPRRSKTKIHGNSRWSKIDFFKRESLGTLRGTGLAQ
jgi:hypothetical protein